MNDICIMGVDPGVTGALAFYFLNEPARVAVEDMPSVDSVVNGSLLAAAIRRYSPSYAVTELVHAMPSDGKANAFAFGKSCGIAIGVIQAANIPIQYVTPSKWKKHFRLPADKEACRARALELFPICAASFARKKDHGRAEAALIAKYGAEVLFPYSAQFKQEPLQEAV